MTKKKSIVIAACSLVIGIAIGVVGTIGVLHNNNEGAIYGSVITPNSLNTIAVPSETSLITEEPEYPTLDALIGSKVNCKSNKIYEVVKNNGEITKERLVSAKWEITIENINNASISSPELIPFFKKLESGERSVEKYLWYYPRFEESKMRTVITLIPTGTSSTIFTNPGETSVNLGLLLHTESGWITDDGKLNISNPDEFFVGNYTTGITFNGTKEELQDSEYSFLVDYERFITFAN